MSAATTDLDDELMLRLQDGDRRAFEELVDRHQGSLLGFFIRQTRDRQLAEDLTQDTLLKVFNQSWDYLPRGCFRGWMFRIARNLMIDNTRRRSHDALVRALRNGAEDKPDWLTGVVSQDASPSEQADRRELAALVEELLGQIPTEQRQTFLMHHYSGLSLPEVALAMEANLPTTKSRLRLAREKLREKLADRGIFGPAELAEDEP